MLIVASGFVFRAVAGAVASDVSMSEWFILCTMFGSLFVVAGKRFAEMLELGSNGLETRSTLGAYTLDFLRVVYAIACAATLISYSLWAFQSASTTDGGWPLYEMSIVPIIAVLLRYVHLLETGHGGAPEEIFFGDRAVQAGVGSWLCLYGAAVYVL
jgi:decaprenyl-phosphate phosphoribosyltransferase